MAEAREGEDMCEEGQEEGVREQVTGLTLRGGRVDALRGDGGLLDLARRRSAGSARFFLTPVIGPGVALALVAEPRSDRAVLYRRREWPAL